MQPTVFSSKTIMALQFSEFNVFINKGWFVLNDNISKNSILVLKLEFLI